MICVLVGSLIFLYFTTGILVTLLGRKFFPRFILVQRCGDAVDGCPILFWPLMLIMMLLYVILMIPSKIVNMLDDRFKVTKQW